MLDNRLTIPSLCWTPTGQAPTRIDANNAGHLTGRFAIAHRDGDHVILTRDHLGLNKLFFGHDRSGTLVAANYLTDLIAAGISFADIYAIPAGTSVTISDDRTSRTARYWTLPTTTGSGRSLATILTSIHDVLTQGFASLAAARRGVPVALCLSGGADSSLIALYAQRQWPDLTAYTYSFTDGTSLSDDAHFATLLAQHLGIHHKIVTADPAAIVDHLPNTITYGQDWRDFNVHAALVNDILAHAIAADHPGALVVTGDLMNEFLGDYTAVDHAGRLHYRLPPINPSALRISLIRGLQTGDREVGIFHAHGLEVAQPYGWAHHQLLELPDPTNKPEIMRHLATAQLPEYILTRPKVRAQIGDQQPNRGILPHLLNAGFDNESLTQIFCATMSITDHSDLHRFVRGGICRPPP